MKWAVIGIIAVVVLGAGGYAIYTLTDAPEQAQEWWDEKKLDNFETLANRELDEFEKKIEEHKATLTKLKTDRIMWAGHEKYGKNEEVHSTGFMTLMGYENQISHRTRQGEALAKAYKDYMNSDSAVINADTGEVDRTSEITVSVPQKDGTSDTKKMSLTAIETYLGGIETELIELEANRDRVAEMVSQYDASIKDWESQVAAEEEQLVELRKEVKMISAEIKLQKAKEDLAELNKAIAGEDSNSELGKLIHKYEERKGKFQREKLVEGDEKAKKAETFSLDDLDKPSKSDAPKTSRFLK